MSIIGKLPFYRQFNCHFVGALEAGQTGSPARLAVITATGYAYERPDGVCVVPLTSMRP